MLLYCVHLRKLICYFVLCFVLYLLSIPEGVKLVAYFVGKSGSPKQRHRYETRSKFTFSSC